MALRSDTPIFLRNTYGGAQWHPYFPKKHLWRCSVYFITYEGDTLLWRQYTIEVIDRGHDASHMTR